MKFKRHYVKAPEVNPLEGWIVKEDIIEEMEIGCDEDGNIHPELLASLQVWARAYYHNKYEAAKKAITDDTN